MYSRRLAVLLDAALADTPVVLVNGARQTGKTTLVRGLAASGPGARSYLTLDDATTLAAVRADPQGFLSGRKEPLTIDEVQHAPELFPAIKLEVDRDRRPGRFLLTGSANVLLLPRLSESLAGRMEIIPLWPLSQSEVEGVEVHPVERLFSPELELPDLPAVPRPELLRRLLSGGYPEPLSRNSAARRTAWFQSYVTTLLQRELRDFTSSDALLQLPRLLSLLAARTSNLLRISEIARDAGLPYTTLYRYMGLLQACFLIYQIPAWSTNLSSRLTKAPKLLMNDTGLAAALMGVGPANIDRVLGALFQSFVVLELLKHATWSQTAPSMFHYRTTTGREVDAVLESRSGEVVGVEIKAIGTVRATDFNGLRSLQEMAGDRFFRGVVVYTGDQLVPFGERLHAVPVSFLWT